MGDKKMEVTYVNLLIQKYSKKKNTIKMKELVGSSG